jgi:sec-independent protein translocase protein TatA
MGGEMAMSASMPLGLPLLAFFGMGPAELMIVGAIAVLLFGSRLPEVARSFGKSFVEFKKGIQGVESEFNEAMYSASSTQVSHYGESYDEATDHDEPVAPKFEPPKGAAEPHDAATGQVDAGGSSMNAATEPQPTEGT